MDESREGAAALWCGVLWCGACTRVWYVHACARCSTDVDRLGAPSCQDVCLLVCRGEWMEEGVQSTAEHPAGRQAGRRGPHHRAPHLPYARPPAELRGHGEVQVAAVQHGRVALRVVAQQLQQVAAPGAQMTSPPPSARSTTTSSTTPSARSGRRRGHARETGSAQTRVCERCGEVHACMRSADPAAWSTWACRHPSPCRTVSSLPRLTLRSCWAWAPGPPARAARRRAPPEPHGSGAAGPAAAPGCDPPGMIGMGQCEA